MTSLRQAAQQALEALKMMRDEYGEYACPACDHADAAIYALRAALAEPVAYTTGHCKEKAKPGGCQLHNLHCGYPKCDRKPAKLEDSAIYNGWLIREVLFDNGTPISHRDPSLEKVAWLFTNVQSGDIEASTNPDWNEDEKEFWHRDSLYTLDLIKNDYE